MVKVSTDKPWRKNNQLVLHNPGDIHIHDYHIIRTDGIWSILINADFMSLTVQIWYHNHHLQHLQATLASWENILSSTKSHKHKAKGQRVICQDEGQSSGTTIHSNEPFIVAQRSFSSVKCFFITGKSLFHVFHSALYGAVHHCNISVKWICSDTD